jgi:hypothetical protein
LNEKKYILNYIHHTITPKKKNNMATLEQKLIISLMSAAVFVLVNLPQTYQLTNKILGGLLGPLSNADGKCATTVGLVVHALVFYLVTRLMMTNAYSSKKLKHRRALIATLVFVILSSPMAFRLVRSVLGNGIANAAGCPTTQGILVHAAVYTAVLVLLMYRRS